MKRGQNTTESITFVTFEGVFSDWGTATNLMSVTLRPESFTQIFDYVIFAGTTINYSQASHSAPAAAAVEVGR